MQARYLPYVLIAPVSVFLGLFFLYPFYLVAQTAFYDGAGWSLKNFREVTSYWKFPISFKKYTLACRCCRSNSIGAGAVNGDNGECHEKGT